MARHALGIPWVGRRFGVGGIRDHRRRLWTRIVGWHGWTCNVLCVADITSAQLNCQTDCRTRKQNRIGRAGFGICQSTERSSGNYSEQAAAIELAPRWRSILP
jgi:hypothetical protein